jgi:large subunit ribosomal protein L18e
VKKTKTTNPQLVELINSLKKQSREAKVEIWADIAERLIKPKRRRIAVNLSRINRYTKKKETVAVPGKVLGSGEISHPVTVAAFAFSKMAEEKIKAARGKCLTFPEIFQKNPKGSNIKIIG